MGHTPDHHRDGKLPRFIPTYVGHTLLGQIINHALTVHPHIRGAYGIYLCWSGRPNGSSPHTWGILCPFLCSQYQCRFIPTYVGHTWPPARWTRPSPVHPHIRGAYYRPRWSARSPTRFIPTYVGHTKTWYIEGRAREVHPHIRGAYLSRPSRRPSQLLGSSPHTWGIPRGGEHL